MFHTALDDLVQYRSAVVPSVEPEKVLVDVFLQILPVAPGVYAPEPVLEVPDLDMEHLEVLSLIGQGLFQFGIVLLEGHVPRPSVRKHLCVLLYVVVEQWPEGFRTIVPDYLGIAPAGLAVPVLEGDGHAHFVLALAPALFPGLRRAYLELVHMDLVLQRVPFGAFHGRPDFLPEQPGRLLVDTEMFGQPDAVRALFTGRDLVEHLQGPVDTELQLMEQCPGGGGFVVAAFAAPAAGRLFALYMPLRPTALATVAVLPLELGQIFVAVLLVGEPVLKCLSIKFFQYSHRLGI